MKQEILIERMEELLKKLKPLIEQNDLKVVELAFQISVSNSYLVSILDKNKVSCIETIIDATDLIATHLMQNPNGMVNVLYASLLYETRLLLPAWQKDGIAMNKCFGSQVGVILDVLYGPGSLHTDDKDQRDKYFDDILSKGMWQPIVLKITQRVAKLQRIVEPQSASDIEDVKKYLEDTRTYYPSLVEYLRKANLGYMADACEPLLNEAMQSVSKV